MPISFNKYRMETLFQKFLFLSKGGENEVYTGNEDIVVKLNNFEYAGDDLWNRWRFVFY